MEPISPISFAAPPATSIASSRARSPPTCRCSSRPSTSTARVLAERMRPLLGQPVIIENVGGAGGSIGVGRLAPAAPDGYTIDLGQWDTHVGNIVYPSTYDLRKDFEPIGLVSINPQLMVARKNFPANDLKELIAWMKAHPGEAK